MVDGRRIPVLIGAIALLSGCGSSRRVEVSGVVRDRDTGRAIAGALVIAADGSATRTDAEGRFVLTVPRSERRMLRASAAAHDDAEGAFDPLAVDEIVFELVPNEDASAADADAVLRWLRESWLDGSDGAEWERDAWRSLEDDAFRAAIEVAHGAGEPCASCHTAEAVLVAHPVHGDTTPHGALAGGCLACHGARSEEGVRMRSVEGDLEAPRCAPCHGDLAPDRIAATLEPPPAAGVTAGGASSSRRPPGAARARAEAAFARRVGHLVRCGQAAQAADRIGGVVLLVDGRGFPLGDCDASGAIDGSEIAVGLEVLAPRVAEAAVDLALLRADRSGGVHQPRLTLLVADRIERTLATH
jgi:hypothetical protein